MNLIIKVILNFVTAIVSVVCTPIDAMISTYIPSIGDALNNVSSMLNYLVPFANWVLSWLPFSTNFYAFLIASLVFIYTGPIIVDIVKLVVKWWHALVP